MGRAGILGEDERVELLGVLAYRRVSAGSDPSTRRTWLVDVWHRSSASTNAPHICGRPLRRELLELWIELVQVGFEHLLHQR